MPYAFTPEDFNKFSQAVLAAEGDQATLTTLLADMNGTVNEAIARDEAATKKVEAVEAENDRLRKANMSLYVRSIGTSVDTKKDPEPEEEKPTGTKAYMNDYFARLDAK